MPESGHGETSPGSPAGDGARAASLTWIPAFALAFAFSPQGLELAEHLAQRPWALYLVVFPCLLAWLLFDEARREPAPRLGWSLVAGALLLQVVAIGGGVARFGRPALAIAVIGFLLARGWCRWRTAILACWIVPVPSLALGLWRPVTTGMGHAAAALAGGVEAGPAHEYLLRLAADAGALLIDDQHGGLPQAALLSGVGWFAAVRSGAPLGRGALGAALLGLAAIAIQAAFVCVAALALAGGAPGAAGALLDSGAWVACGALGIAVVWRAGHTGTQP